ncbi:MAG: histidine phosphatase family protein [Hominenteromicrobium sp.]
MRIFLIRHAESYSNTQGKVMSSTDLSLTPKGIRQAERAGQYLKEQLSGGGSVYAFCSSLRRTRQTAEAFLRQLTKNDVPIVETDLLREMNLGKLEGLTWQERDSQYPEISIETGLSEAALPAGECYRDIKDRCVCFAEKYLTGLEASATVLVFSHGITLRVLTNVLLNRPDRDVNRLNWMENTAVTEIDYDAAGKTGKPVRINDYAHLGELGSKDYSKWGLFSVEAY